MAALNIFKGTLSFNCSDTHHKQVKYNNLKSQEAIKDLQSLLIQTKGNNLDNHFSIQDSFRNAQKNTFFNSSSQITKKKHPRCLSDSQKSRFFLDEPTSKVFKEDFSAKILDKIKLFDQRTNKTFLNSDKKPSKNISNSFRAPLQTHKKQMSDQNFSKYLNFLNVSDHNHIEIANKKPIPLRIPPKNHRQRSSFLAKSNNEINSETMLLKENITSQDFHQLPKVRTMRNSLTTETFIMDKMNGISRKVMKNVKKLEDLNKNNKIKTYNELLKLFDNNTFLNRIFFDVSRKEMNPKLCETFLAQSIVIYPSKFNRNPLENRVKYNYEGIKNLESLSKVIKEFCFNKKLLDLKSEEKGIVDLQKGLKKMEIKDHKKRNRGVWRGIERWSTTIEVQPTFNSQLSKMIKEFEEKHGRLDKIKEKRKIVVERVDNMMQDLYDKFVAINNKF